MTQNNSNLGAIIISGSLGTPSTVESQIETKAKADRMRVEVTRSLFLVSKIEKDKSQSIMATALTYILQDSTVGSLRGQSSGIVDNEGGILEISGSTFAGISDITDGVSRKCFQTCYLAFLHESMNRMKWDIS